MLKQSLEAIFSEYGTILDVVAKRNLRGRGQAFVVFDSVAAAEQAIKDVQGFPLFNKPMVLAFARTRSDATVKREAGEDSREFEAHKRRRLAEKGAWTVMTGVLLLSLGIEVEGVRWRQNGSRIGRKPGERAGRERLML